MPDELHAGGFIPAKDTYGIKVDVLHYSNKEANNTMKHVATLPFITPSDVKDIIDNTLTEPVASGFSTLDVYSRIDQCNHYNDYTILVSVRIEGEEECNVNIRLGRYVDKIYALPDRYKSEASYIIQALRNHVYDEMNGYIKYASPARVSGFFFGNIIIDTPEYGKRSLRSYIIDLNDSTSMTREEIADKIDSLMGDNVPRIPVNPMLWLLEDRPVEVVDEPYDVFTRWAEKVITADKITADNINVGSLYLHEIPNTAKVYAEAKVEDLYVKEDSDGKKWFEVTGVLPPGIDIAGPAGLSVDKPPEV